MVGARRSNHRGVMNVSIHIERLILDGLAFTPGQVALVQAAFEAELGRLLAGGGLSPELAAGAAVPSLPGGTVRVAAGGSPARFGRQVARAVYGGLGR
jgi:hypothetical protein